VTDEAEFNFVVNEKTESMSSSFLDAMAIGDSRKLEYYVHWYIRSRYSSSRSEEFVSLKLLPTTASNRQDSIEKTRIVRMSVKATEILPLTREFPKAKIINDLEQFRQDLYPNMPKYDAKSSRAELVSALCKWRKQYFRDYPEVHNEYAESLDEMDADDRRSTVATREEQAKYPIYCLDEDIKSAFKQT